MDLPKLCRSYVEENAEKICAEKFARPKVVVSKKVEILDESDQISEPGQTDSGFVKKGEGSKKNVPDVQIDLKKFLMDFLQILVAGEFELTSKIEEHYFITFI